MAEQMVELKVALKVGWKDAIKVVTKAARMAELMVFSPAVMKGCFSAASKAERKGETV
jgi:hypothetical protein